jgi:hypothetical protein
VPLVFWLPVNAPPDALETVAVQDVASTEVHVAVTASPRLMVADADGWEKVTVGAAAGAGAGAAGLADPYPPMLPSPPQAATTLTIDPDAILPQVETRMAM